MDVIRQDRLTTTVDRGKWARAFWRGRETSKLKWWFIRRFGKKVTGEDNYGLPCSGFLFRGNLYFDHFNYDNDGEI